MVTEEERRLGVDLAALIGSDARMVPLYRELQNLANESLQDTHGQGYALDGSEARAAADLVSSLTEGAAPMPADARQSLIDWLLGRPTVHDWDGIFRMLIATHTGDGEM